MTSLEILEAAIGKRPEPSEMLKNIDLAMLVRHEVKHSIRQLVSACETVMKYHSDLAAWEQKAREFETARAERLKAVIKREWIYIGVGDISKHPTLDNYLSALDRNEARWENSDLKNECDKIDRGE